MPDIGSVGIGVKNALLEGSGNPCTLARIGAVAWPNSSNPNTGTLFEVRIKTKPPSDRRWVTAGTNSDNSEVLRLPPGRENDASEPISLPLLSIADISTFAALF